MNRRRNAFRSCESAREASSRALDDDLSPFEARLLAAHLDTCAACSEFHVGAATTTKALRAAPLDPLEQPLALPRRRVVRPLHGSAAAAIAAAAVLVLSVAGPVDLKDVSTVKERPQSASAQPRIVPDAVPFPADFPKPNGDRKTQPTEE